MQTHFEKLVVDRLSAIEREALSGSLDNPHTAIARMARLQGEHNGLTMALDFFRRAARSDIDNDDIPQAA